MSDFDEIVKKAEKLRARREALAEKIKVNEEYLVDVRKQVIAKYGTDYKEKYNKVVEKIKKWEESA